MGSATRSTIFRKYRSWVLAIVVALLVVSWFFPPPPYRWFWQSGIEKATHDGIYKSEVVKNYGSYPNMAYSVSEPRWLNPFTVEVDVRHNPGMKAGWGVTLLLRLTLGGWQIFKEKDGYIV